MKSIVIILKIIKIILSDGKILEFFLNDFYQFYNIIIEKGKDNENSKKLP